MRKKKTSCFPKNIVLIRLIERINDTILCSRHNKKLQWICCDEEVELCSECILNDGHRTHKIEQIEPNKVKEMNRKEGEGDFRIRKKHTQIVPVEDQPRIITHDEIYEKIRLIKRVVTKFAGLMLIIFILFRPFLKMFAKDDIRSVSFS